MGRKKISITLIADTRVRRTTFKNRKQGLLKKVRELSALCDVPACVIISDPDRPSHTETWPENPEPIRSIIAKFREKAEEKCVVFSDSGRNRGDSLDDKLNRMSADQLRELFGTLNEKLECLNSKIDFLQTVDSLFSENAGYCNGSESLENQGYCVTGLSECFSYCGSELSVNQGYCGAPENQGYYSTLENKGYYSTSENQGYYSTSDNQGPYSTSQNQAYYSTSQNQDYCNTSENQGYYSTSQNQDYCNTSENQGYYSTSENQAYGYISVSENQGYYGKVLSKNQPYCGTSENRGYSEGTFEQNSQPVEDLFNYGSGFCCQFQQQHMMSSDSVGYDGGTGLLENWGCYSRDGVFEQTLQQ